MLKIYSRLTMLILIILVVPKLICAPIFNNAETTSQKNIIRHITELAGNIGERNIWQYDHLQQAANYIKNTFTSYGYQVTTQSYQIQGKTVENIIATSLGKTSPNEIIVIGAHYDTVVNSPGADDNASGVAALLEIAHLLAKTPTKRTLQFVAFVNEESPFAGTAAMGSYQYAKFLKEKNAQVKAMLALESIGYYSDEKNSQHYPLAILKFFYPNTGNFIGLVSNISSIFLLHQCLTAFRNHSQFPVQGIAAPAFLLKDINRSDHASFWHFGYHAIMVTDTAPFRNSFYHTAKDIPATIDYSRLTQVSYGLAEVINDLAEGYHAIEYN